LGKLSWELLIKNCVFLKFVLSLDQGYPFWCEYPYQGYWYV